MARIWPDALAKDLAHKGESAWWWGLESRDEETLRKFVAGLPLAERGLELYELGGNKIFEIKGGDRKWEAYVGGRPPVALTDEIERILEGWSNELVGVSNRSGSHIEGGVAGV